MDICYPCETYYPCESCRLCEGTVEPLFEKIQLKKYRVKYFTCLDCKSAQTETPYWLEEAYSNLSFAQDTGMVERSYFAASLTLALALYLNFLPEEKVVDFGGGTGLFTRILRDHGVPALWCDKYAKNIFAQGFEWNREKVRLITAFEVFEHFSQPKEELATLFHYDPDLILLSTKLYQNQAPSWWYFLEDGQHIQFYSKEALQRIGSHYGYYFYTEGSTYHLFSKKPLPKRIVKILLKKRITSMARALKRWGSLTIQDHKCISLS